MAITVTLITQDQFDLLNTTVDWHIDEVPKEYWNKIPGLQRIHDTFAILCSGCISSPQLMHQIDCIAGIDVLAYELNPKQGETEGNAYHYVFQIDNDPNYPYKMYGPFRCGARVAHWFDFEDLDNYWKIDTE